jgi:hypothetical protein
MIEPGRVRFCLACGQMLPFEQRTCSSCGHFDPTADQPDEPTAACPACGASRRRVLLFCPRCGLDVSMPRVPAPEGWTPPGPGRLEAASIALALFAPVVAGIGLAQLLLTVR